MENNFDGTTHSYNNIGPEAKPDLRQQDKLVAYFLHPNDYIFSNEPAIQPGERDQVLRRVATFSTPQHEQVVARLSHLGLPREDASEIYEKLHDGYDNFRQIKGMIAVARAIGEQGEAANITEAFHNREAISARDLKLIKYDYHTPYALEATLFSFMDDIKRTNLPTKVQEYQTSLRVLLHALYGKQAEYWEQYKLLYREASRRFGNADQRRGPDVVDQETPEVKQEPSVALITNEGSIIASGEEGRKGDEADAKRVAPIVELIISKNRVPFSYRGNNKINIRSIPANEQMSDGEAERYIQALGTDIRQNCGDMEEGSFKLLLLSTLNPGGFSSIEGVKNPAIEATKNSIYRVVISHVNDAAYFRKIYKPLVS